MTLSRRNRAAVVAALENLRLWCVPLRSRVRNYEYAEIAVKDACEAIDCVGTGELWEVTSEAVPMTRRRDKLTVDARLLRARLALYLRALLRAEAGDFGPWRALFRHRCATCGRDSGPHNATHSLWCQARRCNGRTYPIPPGLQHRNMRPLWEGPFPAAPPTDGGGG